MIEQFISHANTSHKNVISKRFSLQIVRKLTWKSVFKEVIGDFSWLIWTSLVF